MAASQTRSAPLDEGNARFSSRLKGAVLRTDILTLAGVALLLALPFGVYRRSLSDFFMLDDFIWLKAAASHGFFDLMRRETSLHTPQDIFDYPTPYIRPLVDTYFWVTYRIFGFHPAAYHALAVGLHAVTGLLVAVLGWQLSRSRAAGLAAALLFLVLPAYDMAVTWVSEATDLLYTLLYVLALVLFIEHQRRDVGRRLPYAASFAAFALALFAKEPAITFVAAAAIAGLVLAPGLDRGRLKRLAADLVPFALLALAVYLLFFRHEQSGLASQDAFGLDSRLFSNFWDYLSWLTFPFGHIEDYGAVRAITAVSFLAISALAIAHRRRAAIFAFAWTLIALVPISFFRDQPDPRYTYLAAVPFALFLTLETREALSALSPNPTFRTAAVAALLVIALPLLAQSASDRQGYWHQQASYYEALFYQVPRICGPIAPGGTLYVVGSPAFDYAGLGTQVSLNFSYDRVTALRAVTIPEIPAREQSAAACIAWWDGQQFVRWPGP